MSNAQRVAGPLFAKVRDVQTKLDSVGLEVDHVTWQLTSVKVELDYVTRKLDEERRLIHMSFALVVAMLAGIQYSIQWMIWTGHHSLHRRSSNTAMVPALHAGPSNHPALRLLRPLQRFCVRAAEILQFVVCSVLACDVG
jgi:hypothetical protein